MIQQVEPFELGLEFWLVVTAYPAQSLVPLVIE